jgi:hypothetical protein
MKTEIRLGSVVEDGVGGEECAAIDLIYAFLLHEFGQDIYRRIGINQIGDDLEEFVVKDGGNKVHVNIRYPVTQDFDNKSVDEKNNTRLEVVHEALLRVAKFEGKLDVNKLIAIRDKILACNFLFEFVRKTFTDKKHPSLVVKLIINPLIDRFNFYAVVEEHQEFKCRTLILEGKSVLFMGDDFFCYGKWITKNEFVFSGKKEEVQTCLNIDTCSFHFINLTSYSKPPWLTLMNMNSTDKERKQADKDWWHSLPPSIASVIREAEN